MDLLRSKFVGFPYLLDVEDDLQQCRLDPRIGVFDILNRSSLFVVVDGETRELEEGEQCFLCLAEL